MKKYDKEIMQAQLDNEKAVLKALENNYKDALEEINSKIANLMGRADADMQHVIYQVEYQKALKKQIEGILLQLQTNEFDTVSAYLTKSYEEGFLGTMYAMQSQGVPLVFPINQEEIVAAIQHETKLTTSLYNAFDIKDLQKKIAGEISRGFSTGALYKDVARNVQAVTGIGKNKAMRIARTEGHRITETAAHNAQLKAKERGADVVKIWDATLDSKTRDSHARVDGEIKEVEEKFSNGLMYPGDSSGKAEEVINCRCRSRTDARWALEADETKMLGDTSKMTDAQKKRIADKLGIPVEDIDQYSGQIVPINAKNYADFKRQYDQLWRYEGSALQQEAEARIAGYEKGKSSKMAAQLQDNDWSKAKARNVSDEEKRQVIQFAKDKGVVVGDVAGFDGDPELLKAEIETINKACKEFGIKRPITVESRVLDDDRDFAIKDGDKIIFNSKALRDRTVTESNIVNGEWFASKTLEDIALHEIGHIISEENNVNGLAIAKKAYYNVNGDYVSRQVLREFLRTEVSPYSSAYDTEVVTEVIVGNKNNSTEFTKEFVALLNGAVQDEKS